MRRRKGSTLGLVAICVLVIIVIGIAVFFLTKIMSGGREVANTTDAGTLNTAKQMLKIAVPAETGPTYDFTPFIYPPNAGGITLLTYNRAVAAALLISINAKDIGGTAAAKAASVAAEVDKMGTALTAKLTGSSTFSDLQNNTRMWGNNGVTGTVADAAWMKSQDPGATNVYFNKDSLGTFAVPESPTKFSPLNNIPGGVVNPGKYMAGYKPINLPTGQVLFGTPVMPQQAPHLVSYGDFKANQTPFGSAPPNALHVDARAFEQKSAIFGGALACAIVGAIDKGGTAGPLGNGFEFAAALPSGYIEFLNWRANPTPPGYDPNALNGDNIFNEEIGGGPGGIYSTWIAGDTNDVNTTQNVAFMTNANGTPGSSALLAAWCNWAANGGTPPQGTVYAGLRSIDLKPGFTAANPPAQGSNAFNTLKTIYALNQANSNHINDCAEQIATGPNFGLTGPCVTGFGAMQATFQRTVPKTGNPNPSQNFSQVDWAKATVIVAFQGKGGASGFQTHNLSTGNVTSETINHNPDLNGQSINNGVSVYLNATDDSGLGAYNDYGIAGQRIPPNGAVNSMPVPNQGYTLPLEDVGTIAQLMRQTMGDSCLKDVKDAIVMRCQQIQPSTTRAQVDALLNKQFPMASFSSSPTTRASDQTANKLYIYLPNNDLSKPLQIDAGPPTGVSATIVDPDGQAPSMGDQCMNTRYDLQGNLVDTLDQGAAQGDEYVHMAPYVKMEPDSVMSANDHALWWPGSGALRTLGRMTFRETGTGNVTFSQIN